MSPSRPHHPPVVPTGIARRLFLHAQGLLDDPERPATPASVLRLVERMGAVQMDSIRIVERAHHLILAARLDAYRPEQLRRLLEVQRRLFEHWAHDAAAIPTAFFPYWRRRFEHARQVIEANAWWRARLGEDIETLRAHVRERIEKEGPLQSKHFEHEKGQSGGWWSWKPQKAMLEYLWHTGELAIARREHFQKVYDLMERVLPEAVQLPVPSHEESLAWACQSALERLGVATPAEIAGFWRAMQPADAAAWCAAAVTRGEIVEVRVEGADGARSPRSFTAADWRRRAAKLPDPPIRLRVLAPFDPIVWDRRRAARLFGFDYRFEAFVPAAKRQHGYYVMPILEGERLVGRLDPVSRRERKADSSGSGAPVVQVREVWWEPGIRATRERRRGLALALERLSACFAGRS